MKKTKSGVLKRAIVTPDKHAPIHDVPAINVVYRSRKARYIRRFGRFRGIW